MRAHRTDLVSLAFGLLFVGLATWWLVARLLGFVLPPVGWFLAGALLLIGVLGLVGALRAARSAGPAAPETAAGAPPAADTTVTAVGAPTSGPPVAGTFAGPERTDDAGGWPERREWDVAAPVSGASGAAGRGGERTGEWPGLPATGGAGRDEADEWPTDAVTDSADEAVEERPADVPGDVPPAPPDGRDAR